MEVHIDFDVGGFRPREMMVQQVADNCIWMGARRESNAETGGTWRLAMRNFMLSENVPRL